MSLQKSILVLFITVWAVLGLHAKIGVEFQMQLGNPSAATTETTNHSHYLIQRAQYAMDYNDANGQPNWVSWDLTSEDVGGSGRSAFQQDTTLPAGFYQVLTTDYSGSGYDRGHLCPSADRTVTVADNQVVFDMSNMIPQAPDNNQGVWANFETYCRTVASEGNELLITCGPSSFGGSRLPSNAAAIPGYTWKIVVVVPLGAGMAVDRIDANTRVIAIKIPNTAGVRSDPWQNYITTVAQIEADTGFNFFSNPAGIASWHRAHCDSTALDLLNPDDNNATMRLHLIKMVDSYDGRILCHCLTEESPSEETARMLMVKCVEQHRMLPATITFDWGPEGKSNWIQMTMEGLGVTLIFRPKATPISGANIETMFRKLCVELLHNLKGSTKHLQKARMITRAVDPRDRAVWTIPATRELLAEYYDMGNDLPRRNRRAPNLVAQESIRKFGMPPTQILDSEAFRRALLPFVEDITRTVSKRGTVRHREHSYYHNDLRFYAGKDVVVRFDKDDIQHVYVSLPDQQHRTLKCEVVDHALRYATPEDAMRIHDETRKAVAEAKPATIATKAAFVTRVSRKQKALQAEKDRKQRPALAAEPPKSSPQKSPKIIPMPLNFTRLV